MNYTYMLECGDGSFYTGWTTDIKRRLKEHQSGNGAKYTKTHQPVKLVALEIYESKEEAMKREWQIKHQLKRKDKEKLVKSQEELEKLMEQQEK